MKNRGFVVGDFMMFCFFSNKIERTVMCYIYIYIYIYIRSGSLNFF
jgi:hypothetical protein